MQKKKKKENVTLTAKQALAMWKLILICDGERLSRFSPKLKPSDVKNLEAAALIKIEVGKRKVKSVHLTEGGWAWASEGFRAKLSPTPAAKPVLEALLVRVGAYLDFHGLALDDLLRPRELPSPSEAAPATPEERIRAAYLRVTDGAYNKHVRLAPLRAELSGEPAAAVDAALLAMQQRGAAVLYPVDDPQALGPEDEAAALRVAGARRDLICIER